jgi:DNA-binding MarR family transcriptional regulator
MMTAVTNAPAVAPSPASTDVDEPTDLVELAGGLRFAVARLHRLLRQQDQSGLAPALATALATIKRDGPITLSQLAAQEQVAAPTATKLVDKLADQGLVTRQQDRIDKRVCRVEITGDGREKLESIRVRRTEWLAGRLGDLTPSELARIGDALDVMETLIAPPTPTTSSKTTS